jgi:hypothetical protein
VVFLAAVPVAGVALVLALVLKEVPLRESARVGAADVGSGFSMAEGSDSAQQLQIAISRLFRSRGRAGLAQLREASGTELDVANGWCVGQVHMRSRLGRDTSLEAIAERVRVPAPVLRPAFQIACDDGYLGGSDEELRLTDLGQQEVDKLVATIRAWLAAELADWGAADDELLTTALLNIARQVVDDEATEPPPRELAAAGAET